MRKLNNLKSIAQVIDIPIQVQTEFDALGLIFQRQQREDLLTHICKIEKSNKLLKQEVAKANDQIKKLQSEIESCINDQPSELDKQVKDLLELQLRQAHEEVREQFEANRKLQTELALKNKIGAPEASQRQRLLGSIEQVVVDGKKIYSAPCGNPDDVTGYVRLTLQKASNLVELAYVEQKCETDGFTVSSDGKINTQSNLLSPKVIDCFELLLSEVSEKIISSKDEYGGNLFSEECKKLELIIAERKKWPFVGEILIKHKNKIPGYQCIWFEVSEIVAAYETIKNFNFRLSIAAVNEQGESIHPRLEFPEPVAGWSSLKSWYMESEDGYGPKLELRFETSGGHLDINVWDRLHSEDQYTIAVLLESIYHHLSGLNEQWTSEFWSATKWCDAVQRMIAILKSRRSVKFWTM